MAHVITNRCVGTKDQSCVEVCPVACIHPASDVDGPEECDAYPQLYIDPEVCIDCGACVPECPVEAIFYAGDLPDELQGDVAENRDFYQKWTVG